MPNPPRRVRSPLAVELKKRLPFESPLEELLLNMLRTHAVLSARSETLLKSFNVSPAKYNVLRILRGVSLSADPHPRMLPSLEIADRMITRVPDITRLVDGLVHDGLVERVRCTQDRRVVYVGITAKGRRKVDSIDAPLAALHIDLFKRLTRADVAALNRLLDKTRAPSAAP